MKQNINIDANRLKFLNALRSGNYEKGTIKSDARGYPVFDRPEDKNGHCACAIMVELFSQGTYSVSRSAAALGLTSRECGYIQREINDTALTFPEIADRIEREVFAT